MKQIVVFVCALLLCTPLFNCKKEKAEKTIERTGLINFITGQVFIISSKGAKADAKVGDPVKQGMKIKTVGKKSTAEIYFNENAVKILGDTTVEIKKLVTHVADNREDSEFFVEQGRFFSKVTQKLAKGDQYVVRTPTATAGVRGTDFLISEEENKSNVAVLEGNVEVKNNSTPDKPPVIITKKEEVDIKPGEDMVKKQLSADKLRALNILLEIKAMREEIWEKMRQQREEIRKAVEDQRAVDKDKVQQQRDKDKALVEDQKARDRKMIGDIKDATSNKGEEAKDMAKKGMDEAKDVDTKSALDAAKKQKDAMKPQIEKMKIDKDLFKNKQ